MTNVSPDDEHARLVEAVPRHMRKDGTVNLTSLGAEFGIHRSNMKPRVVALAASGALGTNPVLPGFTIKSTSAQFGQGRALEKEWVKQAPIGEQFEVPKGHSVRGVSALVDPHGNEIVKWIKTSEESDARDLADSLMVAFEGYQHRAVPSIEPDLAYQDHLTLYPLPDMHLGMFAWGKETGGNWDLKIAEQTIGAAIRRVIERTAPSNLAVILGGGDQIHADSNENRTAKSGNVLQVDGRYDKVVEAACRMFVQMVDLALQKHRRVIARVLKGNHDEHATVAITYFLKAWYRDDPRVTIDTDPSLFWWLRFGKTLLGATHGHAAKQADMASIMAHRRAEDWGESVFRYVHTFHVHHASLIEKGGVIAESHQSPAAQDAWHWGQGFLSGRSLQSIAYDREAGEVGRSRVAIISN